MRFLAHAVYFLFGTLIPINLVYRGCNANLEIYRNDKLYLPKLILDKSFRDVAEAQKLLGRSHCQVYDTSMGYTSSDAPLHDFSIILTIGYGSKLSEHTKAAIVPYFSNFSGNQVEICFEFPSLYSKLGWISEQKIKAYSSEIKKELENALVYRLMDYNYLGDAFLVGLKKQPRKNLLCADTPLDANKIMFPSLKVSSDINFDHFTDEEVEELFLDTHLKNVVELALSADRNATIDSLDSSILDHVGMMEQKIFQPRILRESIILDPTNAGRYSEKRFLNTTNILNKVIFPKNHDYKNQIIQLKEAAAEIINRRFYPFEKMQNLYKVANMEGQTAKEFVKSIHVAKHEQIPEQHYTLSIIESPENEMAYYSNSLINGLSDLSLNLEEFKIVMTVHFMEIIFHSTQEVDVFDTETYFVPNEKYKVDQIIELLELTCFDMPCTKSTIPSALLVSPFPYHKVLSSVEKITREEQIDLFRVRKDANVVLLYTRPRDLTFSMAKAFVRRLSTPTLLITLLSSADADYKCHNMLSTGSCLFSLPRDIVERAICGVDRSFIEKINDIFESYEGISHRKLACPGTSVLNKYEPWNERSFAAIFSLITDKPMPEKNYFRAQFWNDFTINILENLPEYHATELVEPYMLEQTNTIYEKYLDLAQYLGADAISASRIQCEYIMYGKNAVERANYIGRQVPVNDRSITEVLQQHYFEAIKNFPHLSDEAASQILSKLRNTTRIATKAKLSGEYSNLIQHLLRATTLDIDSNISSLPADVKKELFYRLPYAARASYFITKFGDVNYGGLSKKYAEYNGMCQVLYLMQYLSFDDAIETVLNPPRETPIFFNNGSHKVCSNDHILKDTVPPCLYRHHNMRSPCFCEYYDERTRYAILRTINNIEHRDRGYSIDKKAGFACGTYEAYQTDSLFVDDAAVTRLVINLGEKYAKKIIYPSIFCEAGRVDAYHRHHIKAYQTDEKFREFLSIVDPEHILGYLHLVSELKKWDLKESFFTARVIDAFIQELNLEERKKIFYEIVNLSETKKVSDTAHQSLLLSILEDPKITMLIEERSFLEDRVDIFNDKAIKSFIKTLDNASVAGLIHSFLDSGYNAKVRSNLTRLKIFKSALPIDVKRKILFQVYRHTGIVSPKHTQRLKFRSSPFVSTVIKADAKPSNKLCVETEPELTESVEMSYLRIVKEVMNTKRHRNTDSKSSNFYLGTVPITLPRQKPVELMVCQDVMFEARMEYVPNVYLSLQQFNQQENDVVPVVTYIAYTDEYGFQFCVSFMDSTLEPIRSANMHYLAITPTINSASPALETSIPTIIITFSQLAYNLAAKLTASNIFKESMNNVLESIAGNDFQINKSSISSIHDKLVVTFQAIGVDRGKTVSIRDAAAKFSEKLMVELSSCEAPRRKRPSRIVSNNGVEVAILPPLLASLDADCVKGLQSLLNSVRSTEVMITATLSPETYYKTYGRATDPFPNRQVFENLKSQEMESPRIELHLVQSCGINYLAGYCSRALDCSAGAGTITFVQKSDYCPAPGSNFAPFDCAVTCL